MKTYSEAEAAEVLQMKETTLADLRRKGKVPHIRIADKIIRYTDEHLKSFLDHHSVNPFTK